MTSIYHFFRDLADKHHLLLQSEALEQFPFDETILSCRNKGVFPDMVIKATKKSNHVTGGEMIELKDARSYSVSSFNSTLPQGKKSIRTLSKGVQDRIHDNDSEPFLKEERDVFYLIRGRKSEMTKVCLVHGSFFETIPTKETIRKSFSDAIEKASHEEGISLSHHEKEKVLNVLSKQHYFSAVRKVEKSSIALRFRIMAEARAESNILNDRYYPDIKNQHLHFVTPLHDEREKDDIINAMHAALTPSQAKMLTGTTIHHPFNGNFFVLLMPL